MWVIMLQVHGVCFLHLPYYIQFTLFVFSGMTEYAVMKDNRLEKIVYVLPLLIDLPYIPVIIVTQVYRMVSNLLISWEYLDCQVSSLHGEPF